MKFLLDTHIWLWSLIEPEKLSVQIRAVLNGAHNALFLSPISVWETLILAEKNRIHLKTTPEIWIHEALHQSPVQEAPLTHSIAIKSRLIQLPHEDPADRFIAATAWEYELTLITQDQHLRKAPQLKIL